MNVIENKTVLDNSFHFGTPDSIIRAKDKTKLKAQALQDLGKIAKKGEWFYVRKPEDENTPQFSKWVGQTTSGKVVIFKTDKTITPNSCRQLLKSEEIIDIDSGERIYHFWQQATKKLIKEINQLIEKNHKNGI